MTFTFFFFCLPPGSQYKFDLSEKHKIKLEWPYFFFFVQTICQNNGNSQMVEVLTIILAQNCKSHLLHTVAAVRCKGRHFLMLNACAHVVSFPDQIPRPLVWERDWCTSKITSWPRARLARCLPVVVGKVYEHHTGKVLHSAANL